MAIIKHIVEDKQNLIDISIMYYGTPEGIFAIMKENNLDIESLVKGSELIIPDFVDVNKKMLAYINENNIEIATDSNESDVNDWLLSSGIWDDVGVWRDFEIWNF